MASGSIGVTSVKDATVRVPVFEESHVPSVPLYGYALSVVKGLVSAYVNAKSMRPPLHPEFSLEQSTSYCSEYETVSLVAAK